MERIIAMGKKCQIAARNPHSHTCDNTMKSKSPPFLRAQGCFNTNSQLCKLADIFIA